MKKIVYAIFLLFLSLSAYSQRVIKMESENGVYKIPCTVNGYRLKMVFDTGASVVSMSSTTAQYLYNNHYITDADFISKGQSRTADGRIVDNITVNIRDVAIGTLHINNVKAIILSSQNASLLFGQSALKKIGRYSIDGNNLIIYKGKDYYTEKEIDKMSKDAWKASNEGNYEKAEEIYGEMYYADWLNNRGLYEYGFACSQNHNYQQALTIFKKLENTEFATPKAYNCVTLQINVFKMIADCYLEIGAYDKADFYIDKAVSLVPERIKWADGKTESAYKSIKPLIYINFAARAKELKQYKLAADNYWKVLSQYAKYYEVSDDNLWNICVGLENNLKISKNEDVQHYSYEYAKCMWQSDQWTDKFFMNVIECLMENGNAWATDFFDSI